MRNYKRLYEKLKEMFDDDFINCPKYYFGDEYKERYEDVCNYECETCHQEAFEKWEEAQGNE